MAMKPDERPMSLTTPMPRYALLASTLAANSASCACSTAVSKPKHLSICDSRGCHVRVYSHRQARTDQVFAHEPVAVTHVTYPQ